MSSENEYKQGEGNSQEDYSLDEILREFGGWSDPRKYRDPDSQYDDGPPPDGYGAENASGTVVTAEKRLEGDQGVIIGVIQEPEDSDDAAIRPDPEPEESGAAPEEPLPEQDESAPDESEESKTKERQVPEPARARGRAPKPEKPSKPEKPPKPPKSQKEKKQMFVLPDKQEVPMKTAFKHYSKSVKSIRTRLYLAFVLCLPMIYISFAWKYGLWLPEFMDSQLVRTLFFIIPSFFVFLLGYDVMAKGAYDLLRLRPNIECAVMISCIAGLADAVMAIAAPETARGDPFCAISSLGVFFALWGSYLKKAAIRRNFKTALVSDDPYVVIRQEQQWEGKDCFFKAKGNTDGFVNLTEMPDCAEKAFSYYSPAILIGAFAFAGLAAYKNQGGFVWALAAILAGSIPVSGMLSYSKPFSALSKKLYQSGAAIGGWEGARAMDGDCGIVITDNDLFPKGTIALNGLKIFGDYSVQIVTAYAASPIIVLGSGLSELFADLVRSQGGRLVRVDQFQCYEGGGIGAEMQGNMVLVGSASFMVLMGVRLPRGNKVKHAVYVAINGGLAGMFALNYSPSASIKYSLQTVLKSRSMSALFATKDFIITPTMIKQRFKVPSDNLEFPTVEERIALAEPKSAEDGIKPAIVCRDGFVPFSDVVIGGRRLKNISVANVAINIISGCLGMLLMFFLTFTGAKDATSAANILIYLIMWAVPVFLISGWISKY